MADDAGLLGGLRGCRRLGARREGNQRQTEENETPESMMTDKMNDVTTGRFHELNSLSACAVLDRAENRRMTWAWRAGAAENFIAAIFNAYLKASSDMVTM